MKSLMQSHVLRAAMAVVAMMVLMPSAGTVSAEDTEAYLKDLHIQQRPMVTELTPPPPAGRSEAGLAVSARVDRADRTYTNGDHLVLTVKTTEDAYIWVLDTGTSGKVHQIFPNRHDESNFLAANVPLEIPRADSKYRLAVSHPTGAELITVIASKNKTPPTGKLIDESGGGTFFALRGDVTAVSKDLSITLREEHPVWTKDEVVVRIE